MSFKMGRKEIPSVWGVFFAPVISRKVGKMSSMMMGVLVRVFGFVSDGCWMMSGTRVPPS